MSSKNYATKMIESRDGFSVKLREFLLYGKNDKNLICAFEGLDHPYYGIRIDNVLNSGVKRVNFPMSGKSNVLKLFNLRSENGEVARANAIYFIDLDYDVPANPIDRLYVTPYYSIENFYITNSTYKKIIEDVFDLREFNYLNSTQVQNAEYLKVFNFIQTTIEAFNSSLAIYLNAFLLCARDCVNNDPTQTKSLIQAKKFDKDHLDLFYKIDKNGFTLLRQPDLKTLSHCFAIDSNLKISEADFETKVSYLLTQDLSKKGRGKFLFRAFSDVMEQLWEDSIKTKPKIFISKKQPTLTMNHPNALSDLAQFAETTVCLNNFLSTI